MLYNIDDKVRYLSIDELGSEFIFTQEIRKESTILQGGNEFSNLLNKL